MVELSLAHRVKMDKQASLLEDGAARHRPRALLAVASGITLFGVLLLCLGVLLIAIAEGDAVDRKDVFFFYCTIAFVLLSLIMYDTFSLWHRNIMARPTQLLASAGAGLSLWTVQIVLETRCVWNSSSLSSDSVRCCPIVLSGWPSSTWSKGDVLAWALPWLTSALILLYIAYLVLAVMSFRKSGRPARKDKAPDCAYTYRGVDAVESQTDQEVTEARELTSYRRRSVDLPPTEGKELI